MVVKFKVIRRPLTHLKVLAYIQSGRTLSVRRSCDVRNDHRILERVTVDK